MLYLKGHILKQMCRDVYSDKKKSRLPTVQLNVWYRIQSAAVSQRVRVVG